MNPQDIRNLRLRLGWSMAEMGRRMGCTAEVVLSWEEGRQSPDSDVMNQMVYLDSYTVTYNERVSQTPIAEKMMDEDRLSQLTHRDLINREQK